jgi:hypothetical protein
MTALWDIAPRSLVEVGLTFERYHGDRGSKHLWNAGQLLRDYKAQYPRRLSSSE